MSDNGDKEEKVKRCPFGLECDECLISAELIRDIGGTKQRFSLCSIRAMVNILGELNVKADRILPKSGIHFP